ncbi:unnamed protein product [Lepidochelys olivacea]
MGPGRGSPKWGVTRTLDQALPSLDLSKAYSRVSIWPFRSLAKPRGKQWPTNQPGCLTQRCRTQLHLLSARRPGPVTQRALPSETPSGTPESSIAAPGSTSPCKARGSCQGRGLLGMRTDAPL